MAAEPQPVKKALSKNVMAMKVMKLKKFGMPSVTPQCQCVFFLCMLCLVYEEESRGRLPTATRARETTCNRRISLGFARKGREGEVSAWT